MIDALVKGQDFAFSVIPAKAGIRSFQWVLGPGGRRGDAVQSVLRDPHDWKKPADNPHAVPRFRGIYASLRPTAMSYQPVFGIQSPDGKKRL